MNPDSPITAIKGVGPALAGKLAQLHIKTVSDLLYFFPRRYDDFSQLTPIKDIRPGAATVRVRVESTSTRHVRRGLHVTEAIVADASSKLRVVWFNQPYRAESLKGTDEFYLSGTFGFQRDRFVLQNPAVEKVQQTTKNTARIVPVYPQVQGLKSHQLRQFLQTALPVAAMLPDPLPPEVRQQEGLLPLAEALQQIHFPDTAARLQAAKTRMGFEELFATLTAAALTKQSHQSLRGQPVPYQQTAAQQFTAALPFELTDAQRRASWEILQDMQQNTPMNRMLQGDVGSGKTAVAAMAAFMAQANNMQTTLLAPTEVLANQHAASLRQLLGPLGVEVALATGNATNSKAKQTLYQHIASGKAQVVVGTHALLEDIVSFANLGLVIIDEQHRFGVAQRQKLLQKNHTMPHLLSMTATPIPRSLTLTVYGEMDISILNQRPPGRTPIVTTIGSPHSRAQLYKTIDQQIAEGRQAYIICPLVSDSDTINVKSAETEYQRLSSTAFKHRRTGLLHGKQKSAEKEATMQAFKNGELDILVATTVVEVGVDVPNATIMVVEAAERFGLAQLHQLRGRVGRGHHQSYCFLVPSTANAPPRRLQEVARSDDGFYLAEADLKIRGPGEIYGARQHGALDLRLVRLSDTAFISRVQKAVSRFMAASPRIAQYPALQAQTDRLRRLTVLN